MDTSGADADLDYADRLANAMGAKEDVYNQWSAFIRAKRRHDIWARTAKMCQDFIEGHQWSEEDLRTMQEQRRPALTVNKIRPLEQLITGFFRSNRYEPTALPGHNGLGVQQVADTLTMVLKQISEAQQLRWKDSDVFRDGLATGRGYYDIRMSTDKNALGEVSINVLDPFSVYLSPETGSYDTADWPEVSVTRWMSVDEIKHRYGVKAAEQVEDSSGGSVVRSELAADEAGEEITPARFFGQWDEVERQLEVLGEGFEDVVANRRRRLIRVIDRQYRVMEQGVVLVDLETGVQKTVPRDWTDEQVGAAVQNARAMNLPVTAIRRLVSRVKWMVTAYDRVLWHDYSIYDDFTIVPYFSYFRRGITRSFVDDLIDPQRELNKRRSALLAVVMTTANPPLTYEKGSFDERIVNDMANNGVRNGLMIPRNPGSSPPSWLQPPPLSNGLPNLVERSEADLKEVAGVNDSALGNIDKVQSGRAIEARQRQTIVGVEYLFDNFSRTRELMARWMIRLVQDFYTEPRLMRVRGEDGKPEDVKLNWPIEGQILNNVSLGSYDVVVDEAPVSATFAQAQFEDAMQMRQQGIPIPDDEMLRLSNVPRKDAIIARIEEQRNINAQQQQAALHAARAQVGIPPDAPTPPVFDDELPAVMPAPVAGQPLPETGRMQSVPPRPTAAPPGMTPPPRGQ